MGIDHIEEDFGVIKWCHLSHLVTQIIFHLPVGFSKFAAMVINATYIQNGHCTNCSISSCRLICLFCYCWQYIRHRKPCLPFLSRVPSIVFLVSFGFLLFCSICDIEINVWASVLVMCDTDQCVSCLLSYYYFVTDTT